MQENWVVNELMEGERNVCEMALEPVFRVEGSERREGGGKGSVWVTSDSVHQSWVQVVFAEIR